MIIRQSEETAVIEEVIHGFCVELNYGNEIEKQMILNIPKYINYIAIKAGHVIGGAGYIPSEPKPLGEYLWVAPKFRKGIAGGLLARRVLKATKGKLRIIASVGRSAMYKKLGFKTVYLVLERG